MAKNINTDTLLDCYSCAHSQQGQFIPTHKLILVCSLTMLEAKEHCSSFIYEPGTDASERTS